MNFTHHSAPFSYLPKPSHSSWTPTPTPPFFSPAVQVVAVDVGGTFVAQILFFWLPCAIYMSLPTLFPEFSRRHKLQTEERQPTKEELRECLRGVLVNQSISTAIHLVASIASVRANRPLNVNWVLPGVLEVVVHIGLAMVMRDVIYYYTHRLLHQPFFYKRLHKVHHQVSPSSPALLYL